MEIVKMKLVELNPAKYNPRKALEPGDAAYEKLKKSILSFGNVEPIVWNRTTGNVIGGHQRLRVLLDLGIAESEVSVVELSDADEKRLNIALNKVSGEWDDDKLAALLADISQLDEDMGATGFEEDEINQIFAAAIEVDTADDAFDVEDELQAPAMTQDGDIWILGRHRLICGDSTQEDTLKRLMNGNLADMVLTDPPYNVDYEGAAGKVSNDKMKRDAFYDFILAAFRNIENAMKEDASIYVFHADTQGITFRRAFEDAGFYLSGCCIWKKQSFVMGHSPYQWQHEPVLFGWKKKGRHRWYADRKQSTVWEFDRPTLSLEHPTMKPLDLMEYPIMNSSNYAGLVLDAFAGSGSTLLACDRTGRTCYAAELEAKYCDVIVKRYLALVGITDEVHVLRGGAELSYDEVSKDA